MAEAFHWWEAHFHVQQIGGVKASPIWRRPGCAWTGSRNFRGSGRVAAEGTKGLVSKGEFRAGFLEARMRPLHSSAIVTPFADSFRLVLEPIWAATGPTGGSRRGMEALEKTAECAWGKIWRPAGTVANEIELDALFWRRSFPWRWPLQPLCGEECQPGFARSMWGASEAKKSCEL